MRIALLVAIAACGRVGFDPLGADRSDGGAMNNTMTPTAPACAWSRPDCLIAENTWEGGATGSIESNVCEGSYIASSFAFQSTGTVSLVAAATFDSVVHVLAGVDCSAPQVRCIDTPGDTNEVLLLDGTAGQTFVVAITGGCGPARLSWSMD